MRPARTPGVVAFLVGLYAVIIGLSDGLIHQDLRIGRLVKWHVVGSDARIVGSLMVLLGLASMGARNC